MPVANGATSVSCAAVADDVFAGVAVVVAACTAHGEEGVAGGIGLAAIMEVARGVEVAVCVEVAVTIAATMVRRAEVTESYGVGVAVGVERQWTLGDCMCVAWLLLW